MAKREDIQYVRYYAYGSAAVKTQPEQRRSVRTEAQPVPAAEPIPVPFSPVAVFGAAVAVVMLVLVLVGFVQLNRQNNEIQTMELYMSSLKSENYALNKEYQAGYDLEEIRKIAEAKGMIPMGLVPIEQVKHVTIHIPEPEVVVELPWYQQLWNDFLAMLE